MNAHVTVNDLKLLDEEPRVHDLRLAEALEFAQPYDIRKLIKRNTEELQKYGGFFATVAKNGDPQGRGRPTEEFWLNEPQSLLICMFSRTDKAAEVRQEIIEVFMAWRRGHLLPGAPPIAPSFDFPAEGGPLQAYALKLDTVRLCARIHGTAIARALWNSLALPPVPGHEPEKDDAAQRCLAHLLSDTSHAGRPLREWIEIALDGADGHLLQHLRDDFGVVVVDEAEGAGFVVSNRHPALVTKFAGTPWRDNYSYVLRRLPGARAYKRLNFGMFGQRRGTFIPGELVAPPID